MKTYLRRIASSRWRVLFFRVALLGLLVYIAVGVMVAAKLPPYGQIQTLREWVTTTSSEAEVEEDAGYWIERLRADESLFLHVRHAAREPSIDVAAFDYWELFGDGQHEVTDYVCMNDEGRLQAELLGFAVKQIHPQPTVYSSPSCRAKETAILAFGSVDAIDLVHLHESAIPESRRAEYKLNQLDFFRSFQPKKSELRVVVGHNARAYSNAEWVDRRDGSVNREQAGLSIMSWDSEEQTLVVHFTFEGLTDFVTAVF